MLNTCPWEQCRPICASYSAVQPNTNISAPPLIIVVGPWQTRKTHVMQITVLNISRKSIICRSGRDVSEKCSYCHIASLKSPIIIHGPDQAPHSERKSSHMSRLFSTLGSHKRTWLAKEDHQGSRSPTHLYNAPPAIVGKHKLIHPKKEQDHHSGHHYHPPCPPLLSQEQGRERGRRFDPPARL